MMISSLFTRFILWLKKILHIRLETEHKVEPVKIPQQPEEKSIEVTSPGEKPRGTSPEEEKPAERPLSEKKTTEVTLLGEQRPPAISSEKEPREQLREEILREEPSPELGASSAIKEIETELEI